MGNEYICTNCGSIGYPKTKTPGSSIMELILWLLFLIPGFLYSMWRITARYKVCSKCGKDTIIPSNSPLAQQLMRNLPTSYSS